MRAFAFILLLLVMACSDRPSREKFPGAQGRTTDVAQVEATKAVMGALDPSKNAAMVEDSASNSGGKNAKSMPSESRVSGTVLLSPKSKAKVKAGMFFFIAARSPQGGPPLAVKRLGDVKFPYNFELSEADAMIPGRVIQGKVFITARLKKSSDPLAQDEGDLYGQVEAQAGQSGLKIVLE